MGRIKIEMPSVKLTEINIPVRITDINYGNHVGNDAFVAIIHEARLQWLNQKGYSELSFDGAGLIMSDLAMEFKNESFYGDLIHAAIYAGEISRVSFELYYQLTTERANTRILLMNAKTGMIHYNYETKKTVSLSDRIKNILSGN
ncbi:MAG: acyl-CoA thioesterase [Chitinophagaceae bacterium]|nr:acyl-CoA thioesterase [Chitinophagaceae bacterium]